MVVLGCGGGEDEEISCSLDERRGTYLAEFRTVDGNCGEQTSAVLRLDSTAMMNGCTVSGENVVSTDQCSLTSTVVCPFDQLAPGATLETTMISRQEADDGSRITGTMTMGAFDANGIEICFGTYRVTAERQ
jgi:hypothetical protein